MAKKKVIGEDGKTYVMKEKKPIYKWVWFWILAVMILVAFGSSLGGGDESANGGETNDNSSQSDENIEKSIDTTESTLVETNEADTTKKETSKKEDIRVDESIPTEHKSTLRSFEVPFSNCI